MSTDKSILLVINDTDASTKLKGALLKLGIDVVVASALESACLQLENGTFDLIVIVWDEKKTPAEVNLALVRAIRASNTKIPMMVTAEWLSHNAEISAYESPFAALDEFDYVSSELAKRIRLSIRRHEWERQGCGSTWRLGINPHLNDPIVPTGKIPLVTETETRAVQAVFASGCIAPTFDQTSDGWKEDLRMVKTGLSNLLKQVGSLGEGAP